MNIKKSFTPALGYTWLTPLYDTAIATLTRESVWRTRLIREINPSNLDSILDVGCGTGSLAILLKSAAPESQIIGVDPDDAVLSKAREKALASDLNIDWYQGFLTASIISDIGPVTKVVSSLVLHQTPVAEKLNILSLIERILEPGGQLFIADYGLQRSVIMRMLFRATVQMIDGKADTTPNALGELPDFMKEAGLSDVREIGVIPTLTGSISIYSAVKI